MSYQAALKKILKEERKDLITLIIYSAWVGACSLIIPLAVQTFVSTIGFGLLYQPILILTFVVFSVLAFSGVLEILKFYTAECLQARLFVKIALRLAFLLPRVEGHIFYQHSGVSWVNRFFDIAILQKTATTLVLDGIAVFLQVIFGMILITFYHPFLLGINLFIIFSVFFVFFKLVPSGILSSVEESKAKLALANWLQQTAQHSENFQTKNARSFVLKRTDELCETYVQKRKKNYHILLQQHIGSILIQLFTNSILLGVGGYLVIQGQLTLGQLIASELILSSVISGIIKFIKYFESYYDFVASLEKISQLLRLPIQKVGGEEITASSFSAPLLEVQNLALLDLYEKKLFQPLSFKIYPHQKLGILAPPGMGKTRILRTLYGLNNVYQGSIKYYGTDMRYFELEEVRNFVTYFSKIALFDGSLLQNFRFDDANLSLSEIQKSIHQVGLSSCIQSLPEGLNTIITNQTNPLSTNQAKKIIFARLSLSKYHLLLIDAIIDSDPFWKEYLYSHFSDKAIIAVSTNPQELSWCEECIELK